MDDIARGPRFPAWIPFVAAVLALGAENAAAGTSSASFGVSLRITASCESDGSAAVQAPDSGAAPRLEVRCAIPTPRAVGVTQEPDPTAPADSAGTPAATARVITLTF